MNKLLQKHFLLILLIVLTFVFRLYQFSSPVADWHSWRQADTSAVTRNFYTFGFDVLHPRFDDLSNVPSGLDNPQGYRFVEFPLYNLLSAGVYSGLRFISIEQAGRLVSMFSSMGIVLLLYLLVKKYLNATGGYLAAAFYAFSPFTIYYGRAILPDTTMAAFILAGIYFFDRWATVDEKSKNKKIKTFPTEKLIDFILAVLFTAGALLLKPYAVFFSLPLFVIIWNSWKMRAVLKWELWLFALLTFAPFVAWRMWMMQYPEGIPANQWLLNGNGIRFRPAFFRWIGYERIIKLLSGYGLTVFLLAGIYQLKKTKQALFFLSFLISSVLYVTVFATGNVQHDYYQILIMPTLAIYFGLGAYVVLHALQKMKFVGPIVVILVSLISFAISWHQVKDYFNINNPRIVTVGQLVDQSVPQDAKVIALYQGDTSFLYQTNRQGWASFQNPLPEMIDKGADFLAQLDPTSDDIAYYEREYTIVASSSGYVLVDLR